MVDQVSKDAGDDEVLSEPVTVFVRELDWILRVRFPRAAEAPPFGHFKAIADLDGSVADLLVLPHPAAVDVVGHVVDHQGNRADIEEREVQARPGVGARHALGERAAAGADVGGLVGVLPFHQLVARLRVAHRHPEPRPWTPGLGDRGLDDDSPVPVSPGNHRPRIVEALDQRGVVGVGPVPHLLVHVHGHRDVSGPVGVESLAEAELDLVDVAVVGLAAFEVHRRLGEVAHRAIHADARRGVDDEARFGVRRAGHLGAFVDRLEAARLLAQGLGVVDDVGHIETDVAAKHVRHSLHGIDDQLGTVDGHGRTGGIVQGLAPFFELDRPAGSVDLHPPRLREAATADHQHLGRRDRGHRAPYTGPEQLVLDLGEGALVQDQEPVVRHVGFVGAVGTDAVGTDRGQVRLPIRRAGVVLELVTGTEVVASVRLQDVVPAGREVLVDHAADDPDEAIVGVIRVVDPRAVHGRPPQAEPTRRGTLDSPQVLPVRLPFDFCDAGRPLQDPL